MSITTTTGALTTCTIGTAPSISIISVLSATRPLIIYRSGRRHRWAIRTTPHIIRKPAFASETASEPVSATTQPTGMHLASTESGETTSSVLGPTTPPWVPPRVSAEFHDAPLAPAPATERGTAKSGKPQVRCPHALARYPRRRLGPQPWASRGPERRLMLRPA